MDDSRIMLFFFLFSLSVFRYVLQNNGICHLQDSCCSGFEFSKAQIIFGIIPGIPDILLGRERGMTLKGSKARQRGEILPNCGRHSGLWVLRELCRLWHPKQVGDLREKEKGCVDIFLQSCSQTLKITLHQRFSCPKPGPRAAELPL